MSRYYEASIEFDKVKRCILDNEISGIAFVKEEDEQVCIKDDSDNHVWLREGDIGADSTGLKRWGMNNPNNIIEKLEKYFDTEFVDEEDLGVLHLG